MEKKYILAINPGSTSTKVSVFIGAVEFKTKKLDHLTADLEGFESVASQYDYRLNIIMNWLKEEEIRIEELEDRKSTRLNSSHH